LQQRSATYTKTKQVPMYVYVSFIINRDNYFYYQSKSIDKKQKKKLTSKKFFTQVINIRRSLIDKIVNDA